MKNEVQKQIDEWNKFALRTLFNFESMSKPSSPELWATGQTLPPKPNDPTLKFGEFLERLEAHKYGTISKHDPLSPPKMIISAYLGGIIATDKKGVDEHQHVGGVIELVGRYFLAQLLKSDAPIPREIRCDLAWLFDPFEADAPQHCEREIVVKYRRKGGQKNQLLELQIKNFFEIDLPLSAKVEATTAAAMAKFGLSRSSVLAIWKKVKPPRKKRGNRKNLTA